MTTNAADLRYSYSDEDFVSSHSTQKFPLGYLACVESENGEYLNVYMYGKAVTTELNAYQPHQRDAGFEFIPIRDNTNYIPLFVPQFNIGPNQYGFALYRGKGKANVRSGPSGVVNGTYFTARLNIPEFFSGTNTNMSESEYGTALEPMNVGETKVIDVHMMGRSERLYPT